MCGLKRTLGAAAQLLSLLSLLCAGTVSCEDQTYDMAPPEDSAIPLEELARIFSRLPIGQDQMNEVYDAVMESQDNGYDDEYMMEDILTSPGAGVGAVATRADGQYERPLRALLEEYLESSYETRSGGPASPSEYLTALEESGTQIYWPYADRWDGSTLPVVTFDPGENVESNIGYEMLPDGSVREVVATEALAGERPVWVINRNEDSEYQTIEMLRKQDPDWGKGGGVIVHPSTRASSDTASASKTLLLKNFKATRNFDCWLAGASEFWIKCASLEDFTATTEAEMRLYSPTVTDFMIVVRRDQVGYVIPFDAILVSEWTDQLNSLAFMITEDDGGTITTWKCSAKVTVKSKSYGFDIEIPFNSYDDIVWRGNLSRSYFEKKNNVTGHFGDVHLTFEIE